MESNGAGDEQGTVMFGDLKDAIGGNSDANIDLDINQDSGAAGLLNELQGGTSFVKMKMNEPIRDNVGYWE